MVQHILLPKQKKNDANEKKTNKRNFNQIFSWTEID